MHPSDGESIAKLSAREIEVLLLICDGLASKQIAAKLGITSKTVEFHRGKIKQRLGVDSVALMVRWAVRENVIQP